MDVDKTAVSLQQIRFGYDAERTVFDGLDFSVPLTSRIGLLGPNGSGKTTLLHLIVGLLRPQAGRVILFGVERKTEKDFRAVRPRIGLLFQDSGDQLFSPTVAEDVAFGPLNLGIPHDKVRQIVGETLEAVGLAGYEDRITYRFSGGEKRLVALATVLAMKPEILLLDEPFAGLDPPSGERIAQVLEQSRLGCVVISHRRHDLERITDSILVLKDGKLSPEGQ